MDRVPAKSGCRYGEEAGAELGSCGAHSPTSERNMEGGVSEKETGVFV